LGSRGLAWVGVGGGEAAGGVLGGGGRRWPPRAGMRRGRGIIASRQHLSSYSRGWWSRPGSQGGLGGGRLGGARRRCTGRRWGAVCSTSGGQLPYKWARRPPASRSRMSRRVCRPKPRPARVTGEEQGTDRGVRGGRGRRRLRRLHAGGDSEGLGARNTWGRSCPPWEQAPASPDTEVGAARRAASRRGVADPKTIHSATVQTQKSPKT
jgi:hypothetical protein